MGKIKSNVEITRERITKEIDSHFENGQLTAMFVKNTDIEILTDIMLDELAESECSSIQSGGHGGAAKIELNKFVSFLKGAYYAMTNELRSNEYAEHIAKFHAINSPEYKEYIKLHKKFKNYHDE